MTRERFNPAGVHVPKGYSHVGRAGNTLYIAGQVALDPEGNVVGHGDIEAQARQAFTNLRTILASVGADWPHVMKMTTLITHPDYLPPFRRVRDEFLAEPYPPNTLIVVESLARPDFLIEIEAIAVLDG